MWNLSEDECLEICKCINADLNWTWNDHFESENPQNTFYAVNGSNESDLWMVEIKYPTKEIAIIKSSIGDEGEMIEEKFDYAQNDCIKNILRKDGALEELKKWKEKLDLELITQEQYDEKKNELGKYIL